MNKTSGSKPTTTNPNNRKGKTPNRPLEFREAIAPALPLFPTYPLEEPPVTGSGASEGTSATPARTDWLRYGMYLVWALAAVTGGIGAGLLLVGKQTAISVESPVPVATQSLTVNSAAAMSSSEPELIAATPTQAQPLTVQPASAITQAQAGSPLAVAALSDFQSASGLQSSLQPGYDAAGLPQGQIGTDPVK